MFGFSRRAQPAPRVQRAQARAIDTGLYALFVGPYLLLCWLRANARRDQGATPNGTAGPFDLGKHPVLVRVGTEVARLLGERFGSPGQRIVGLRTVDSRTEAPVALPLSAALAAGGIAANVLSTHFIRSPLSAEAQAQKTEFENEVEALRASYGDDHDGFRRAVVALYGENHVAASLPLARFALSLTLGVVLGVAQRRLRRALAPTIVVVRPTASITGRTNGRSRRA